MEPIELDLTKLDGNAYALMGAFRKAARQQGRTEIDIQVILKECKSGDYDHLLQTLIKYTL